MNYREAMEYVESLQQYGSVLGLENMQRLCERLGNPQNELKFVHIAGTNGKGSVLAYVSTILQSAGYKVGRYISPTLFDYRERFQIDGKKITQSGLCKYLDQVKEVADQMVGEELPHPTPFEIETAVAFLYFLDKQCDIVVLETGLGGRLDATNIIQTSLCSVFTSISMDHMAVLGETLEEIAVEKVGIIKEKSCVVSLRQKTEVMQIVKQVATKKKCRMLIADTSRAKQVKYGLKTQHFSYDKYKNPTITMPGQYQVDNAILAVEVIGALQKSGFPVTEEQLRKGLMETTWIGRFSVIGQKPLFVVDGAHNEDGAARLAEAIRFYFTNRRIIYIMGILKDKEYDKIIRQTFEFAEHIITVTPPNNERALHGYELAQTVQEYHESVTVADSLQEAVEIAYLLTGRDKETVVIAFGSLSYLGELINIVEHRDTIRRDSHGRSE